MKIRADFVTNSSSSSFVAYGIYDEEIKNFVLSFLKDEVYDHLNCYGAFHGVMCDCLSCFTVYESGLSIDTEIGNVADDSWLNISQIWEEDDYTNAMALGDGSSMMKTSYIVDVLKRFMKELSVDEEKQLNKLIAQSKRNKLIEDKVYPGESDGVLDVNTFDNFSAKKKVENNKKKEFPKSKEAAKKEAAKKETAKRENAIKSNNGFYISNGVLLECKSEDENVVIPYGITKIANKAFMKNKNTVTVEIPDTVEYIGKNAFSGCENLTSISIPKSVKRIDDYAFNNCKSLNYINIENGVAVIEDNAFANCKALRQITIPESVVRIGHFPGCKNLERIDVDSNNKYLYSYEGVLIRRHDRMLLCYPPAKQSETFEIPNGVEKIIYFSFNNCAHLRNLVIPSTVTFIDSEMGGLRTCKKLENIYIDEENEEFRSVDGVVFDKDLTKLLLYPPNKACESYKLSQSVLSVHLEGCSKLKHLIITECLNEIEIVSCKKLKTVIVPYCLKHWAENNLKESKSEVAFYGEMPTVKGNEDFQIENGALIEYQGEQNVVEVPQGVIRIEKYAFYGADEIVKVILPDTVKFIGDYAFANCENLKKINLPDSVEYIGERAFENCYDLKEIRIPNNPLLNFGFSSFSQSGLNSVEIGCDRIVGEIFTECSYLSRITMNNVKSVDFGAFFGCAALKSINLPASVEHVKAAFGYLNERIGVESITVDRDNPNYCSVDGVLFSKDLSTLVYFPVSKNCDNYRIPDTVKYIGENAFNRCKSLKNVIIPQGVEIIDSYAFDGCENIKELPIPNTVKNIGSSAFCGCKSLNNVIIPQGVEIIESNAFQYCKYLDELTIPNTVKIIGSHAFSSCQSLKNLIIPQSVECIGRSVFSFCDNLKQITLPKRFEGSIDDIMDFNNKTKVIYE